MALFDNLKPYDVILASGSPRRRELLGLLDIPFKVCPLTDVDESYPLDMHPEEVPLFLARKKGAAAMERLQEGQLVITADTVVVCQGEVLGKPHDKRQAEEMLRMMSGRKHTVVTGVSVATTRKRLVASATTEVRFAQLSPQIIEEYVDRYRPFDKAGAYGIQEWIGAVGIEGISGSFYNVMGLPLHLLTTLLLKF